MIMHDEQCSTRSIAKRLCRSVSTISRELKRSSGAGVYDANLAHLQYQALTRCATPYAEAADRQRLVSSSEGSLEFALVSATNCRQTQDYVARQL